MRIYLIPAGWDRELVLKTVFKSASDKVCLLSAYPKKAHTYSPSDAITKKVNTHLVTELSKFTTVDVLEVNYIDFNDIVLHVNKYLKKHPNDQVTVNISTGSHLLAATLMLVAHMNNLPIEYSIAHNHNPHIMELIESGHDYHRGFSHILTLPRIPFAMTFTQKERELLKKLKTGTLGVAQYIAGATGNKENRMRSEFHYLAKKLEHQGIIKITSTAHKFHISLTPFGHLCVEHFL